MTTPSSHPMPPTISPQAILAGDAKIYPGAWIGPHVEIGPDCTIAPGAVVGFGNGPGSMGTVRIGEGCYIGPGAHLESGVQIEPHVRIESGTVLRAGTVIREGAFVGPRCVIMGNCTVGPHAMLYAEVHICEFAALHENCQIMPGVKLLNDPYPPTSLLVHGPIIGPCAVIGVNSIIWPGVEIGYHAMVASLSEVKHNVPQYILVRGSPAEPVCDVRKIRMKLGDKWVYPYPWMRHNMKDEDITKPLL